MTGRLRTVTLAFLLTAGLAIVPSTVADCPEVPYHCEAKLLERLDMGDSKLDAGPYEDDPSDANSKLMLAVQQASQHQPVSDGDGELEVGETGGILVIINATGNATRLTVTLDPDPTGITYLNGNTLTIDPVVDGDYHLIPFRVDKVTDGLGLSITIEDQDGKKDSATLRPFGLPPDPGITPPPDPDDGLTVGQWFAIAATVVVSALVILLVVGVFRKKT